MTKANAHRGYWAVLCGLLLLAACFCVGCRPAADATSPRGGGEVEILRARGGTMGTYYQVTIAEPPESLPADWQQELDLTLRRVNDAMSTYLETSEISRFNDEQTTEWFAVSEGFAEVVRRALEIAEASGGALDITVSPLVDAWSFGPAERRQRPPSEEELRPLRQLVDYRQIEVREDPPAVRKADPAMRIDLSAIAKGYAVDLLVEQLRGFGCRHAFVDIGGENRAMGRRGERTWRVAIEDPQEGKREYRLVFELNDQAIATSGDYRNYFEFEGQRYSHTIDPRTGRPVVHNIASVSVFADDCMTADGWATALNVLGVEKGIPLAEQRGLEVRMVERIAEDEFASKQTSHFPDSIPLQAEVR